MKISGNFANRELRFENIDYWKRAPGGGHTNYFLYRKTVKLLMYLQSINFVTIWSIEIFFFVSSPRSSKSVPVVALNVYTFHEPICFIIYIRMN